MCLIKESINAFIGSEASKMAEDQTAYKWKPLRAMKCSTANCNEKRTICKHLVAYFKKEVKSVINPVSHQPYQENYFRNEATQFSELNRVTDNPKLSRAEKLNLISPPEEENIRDFILKFLTLSYATPEILLYAIIILEKFLKRTKWTLRATTWRILFMLSVRVAQRVEEHAIMSTETISELYPLFTPKELQTLEGIFLRLLDYRCFVDYERYAEKVNEIFAQAQIRARIKFIVDHNVGISIVHVLA